MSEKIKILRPGQILDYVDTKEHLQKLFNYITNLQKENKHLSKSYADAILFNQKRCEQNKELKQRIDKAIEYIKKNTHEYEMFNKELGHFSNLTNISIDKNNKIFIDDLLKILGGAK